MAFSVQRRTLRVSSKAVMATLLTVTLAACSSTGVSQEVTRCTFPDSARTPAPSFICDQQVPGFPITRLTSVSNSELATNRGIELARVEAQNKLALEWLSSWFPQVPVDQEIAARQIILDWLNTEFRVVRSRQSPSGTFWLLLGIAHSEVEAELILRRLFTDANIKTGLTNAPRG